MSELATSSPLSRLSSLPRSRLGLLRHHSGRRYNECVTWFALCLFSSPNIVVNFLRFCGSWRLLFHSTFPSVRQSFSSPSIEMPLEEFFSPKTTLIGRGFFSGTRHSCSSLLSRLHPNLRRARSSGRWRVAPRLSIAVSISTPLSHFFSSFIFCLLNLLSNTSMRNKYIHHKLVGKDALRLHFVLAYLQLYVDDSSMVFMYSAVHMSMFGAPHLKGGAWYFDCQLGFTSLGKEAMFSSLSSMIEAVADEKEAMQPAQWRSRRESGERRPKMPLLRACYLVHRTCCHSFSYESCSGGICCPY